MRENSPVSDTMPEALPASAPSASPATAAARGGHSAAVLPHRRANVEAQWRQARAWISVAFPRDLDAAMNEVKATYPDLHEHVSRLKQIADAEGIHYEAEPGAGSDAFQAAVKAWEAGVLDALAALATKGNSNA